MVTDSIIFQDNESYDFRLNMMYCGYALKVRHKAI